jgi:hypothetical protein
MENLKSIIRATIGVTLAVLLLPVFVWLDLAALGASIAAAIIGAGAAAWQMRKFNHSDTRDQGLR